MDVDTNLADGLGQWLATQEIGSWAANGVYADSNQTAIVVQAVPQSPDRLVTLTLYGIGDAANFSDSAVGLQVRTRWAGRDPRAVNNLAGRLFDALHGIEHLTVGGVHIVQVRRLSWVSLGTDGTGRWSRSDNYALDLHYPSTHRT